MRLRVKINKQNDYGGIAVMMFVPDYCQFDILYVFLGWVSIDIFLEYR